MKERLAGGACAQFGPVILIRSCNIYAFSFILITSHAHLYFYTVHMHNASFTLYMHTLHGYPRCLKLIVFSRDRQNTRFSSVSFLKKRLDDNALQRFFFPSFHSSFWEMLFLVQGLSKMVYLSLALGIVSRFVS